jgi:hypothetical protein
MGLPRKSRSMKFGAGLLSDTLGMFTPSLIEIILRGLVVFGRRSRPNTTKKKLLMVFAYL